MEHYLCLTDLLDQDLSAYEYFQTLPPAVQTALRLRQSRRHRRAQFPRRRMISRGGCARWQGI